MHLFYIIAELTLLKVDLPLVLRVCGGMQLNMHYKSLIIIISNL